MGLGMLLGVSCDSEEYPTFKTLGDGEILRTIGGIEGPSCKFVRSGDSELFELFWYGSRI
jgi:hypothetical protein